MQAENADENLFQFGLSISDRLDHMFGIRRQFKTLSQRDVPGILIRSCKSSTRSHYSLKYIIITCLERHLSDLRIRVRIKISVINSKYHIYLAVSQTHAYQILCVTA